MKRFSEINAVCLVLVLIAMQGCMAAKPQAPEQDGEGCPICVRVETSGETAEACQSPTSCPVNPSADACARCRGKGNTECPGICKINVKPTDSPAVDPVRAEQVAVDAPTAAVEAEDEHADHPGGPPAFTRTIHALLNAHEQISREVTDLPDGIESVTTSEDPQVTAMIRKHLGEMAQRLEAGLPVRLWDPLFRELYAHQDQIHLEITEIEGGVRVRETSDDPTVVLLIRQHAYRGVSEFVRDGFERAHQATPLPEGYEPTTTADEAQGRGMGRGHGMGMGPGHGRGMGHGRLQDADDVEPSPDVKAKESAPGEMTEPASETTH